MSGRQERLNIILLRELLALGAFFLLISTAMAQSGNLGDGEEGRECRNCHQENKRPARYDAIRPWLKSRHAEAGVACVDCHLKKEMEKEDFYKAVTATTKESAHAFMVERPAAKETKMYFVGVCGGCHKERLDEFNASVHGIANRKGKSISCIDCHDPHSVSAASNTDSRLYKGNDLKTCGRCHKDMLDSYMSTFHGKQFVLGNTLAPTCAYCHMGHELPPDDPGSALNAKNIGNICAGCHGEAAALGPDADEMMIHTLSRDSTRKVTHFRDPVAFGLFSIASVINSSYITMIIGVVGFFTLMSTRDFIKKTKMTYSHGPGSEEKTINRFSLAWRLQHFFWAIAFIVLAATGLSLKFPDSVFSGAIVWAAGGPAMRSVIHRIAAVVFIGTALAHIIPYVLLRRPPGKVILSKKDFLDALLHLSYLFDRTDNMPLMGRYTWYQKLEYWATVVGACIIISTGFLMWGFVPLIKKIPISLLYYAQMIHGWEAILAVLVIFVQHIYQTVLNPLVFPMDFSWLTGRTKYAVMEHEHPLELMEIESKRRGEYREGAS